MQSILSKHPSIKVVWLSLAALTLTACGGGGGSDSDLSIGSVSSNSGLPANGEDDQFTGSVVEKLDLSTAKNIIYAFPFGVSGVAKLDAQTPLTQQGLVTKFSNFEMSGDIVAKEIQGNKNYLIARLTRGTADYTETHKTPVTHRIENIENYANGSYYYFVSQPLTSKLSLSTSRTVSCTDYNITKAKRTGGNGSYFITPTLTDGNLTIGTDGTLTTKFAVRYNNEHTLFEGKDSYSTSSNSYSSYKILSHQNVVGSSSAIGSYNIGQNGKNSLVVGAIYTIKLNNGSSYQGALSMVCNYS